MKSRVVLVNVVVLLAALVGFFVIYSAVTDVGNNRVLNGTPYSEGYYATYSVEGPLAASLGAERITMVVRSVKDGVSTIEVLDASGMPNLEVQETKYGTVITAEIENDSATDSTSAISILSTFEVNEMEGTLISGPQQGRPLIFFANIPSAFPMLPTTWQKFYTFRDEGKLDIPFATFYTGIDEERVWKVRELREDSFVYYHTKYGPNASYRFVAREDSSPLGHVIIDQTSGLMLHAESYTNGGKNTLELVDSNYPTTANRWNFFYWPNGILILWGIWHLWRLKRHPEAQYFDLTPLNIARFFVRVLAFTVFDFGLYGGASILTGDVLTHVIIDSIGFVVMLFGVGIYAFMVLFKFTGLVPGFMYPYGVPLYFCAVIAYEINSYRLHKRKSAEVTDAGDKG